MVTPALAVTAPVTPADLSADPFRAGSPKPRVLAQAEGVLVLGSTDSSVKELQAMLALMGYYSGAVDGTYGQGTMAAVRQFQTDAGLEADGIVGPATWRRLLPTPAVLTEPQEPLLPGPSSSGGAGSPSAETSRTQTPRNVPASGTAGELQVLRLDDVGADVSKLQRRLSALNFYTGPIDGVFGSQTQRAVENFQRQAGLGVDGIVGAATWQKLLQ
ncbi:peptidoglycan-binding domain-containing protein [Leptothoe sp. PORK10 BA2]|uniref:peptidoglycan-binding domain-containing protein n=1 Tax=Leptothoe sp. PORK10 BA2 TaxID=3110254 RepID=UPI002B204665|nr:peptidoglycan-binding protein [Leptothoe sp. PORK10 BA2]MEA5462129.1 peptidoglycan-binding protein [Leptothoe sp. PORK10 BA2]